MAMLFPLSQPESRRFFRDCNRPADEDLARRSGFFLGAAVGLMVGTPERSYDLSIFHGDPGIGLQHGSALRPAKNCG
jgi:hypothetical protein